MLVTDTSVSAAWLLLDESNSRANDVYEIVEVEGCLVTQHWHLEMRSALLRAERRGRMNPDEVDMGLHRLAELTENRIVTDSTPNLDTAFSLARTHRLSFYDALYLELAMRRNMPLATLDSALDRAAISEGLPALP
ncbi:MAG: type II toxin-antitoxin system VapC family toxin [Chloroflexi bacterium]|nr:type II toxin-antitoxin system VapC family toxin [Chloroflexota bacterium]